MANDAPDTTPEDTPEATSTVDATAGDNEKGKDHARDLQAEQDKKSWYSGAKDKLGKVTDKVSSKFYKQDAKRVAEVNADLNGDNGPDKQKQAVDARDKAVKEFEHQKKKAGGTGDWLSTFDGAFELTKAYLDMREKSGLSNTPAALFKDMKSNIVKNIDESKMAKFAVSPVRVPYKLLKLAAKGLGKGAKKGFNKAKEMYKGKGGDPEALKSVMEAHEVVEKTGLESKQAKVNSAEADVKALKEERDELTGKESLTEDEQERLNDINGPEGKLAKAEEALQEARDDLDATDSIGDPEAPGAHTPAATATTFEAEAEPEPDVTPDSPAPPS